MQVFVSWSGKRSQEVAQLLVNWLPRVIQRLEPWISDHIESGAAWFNEIFSKLGDSQIGIICLTPENCSSEWLLFESGALVKGLAKNRVCVLLIDLKPSDVKQPLGQFQLTEPREEGMKQLMFTLNGALQTTALKEKTLSESFDAHWPHFASEFAKIVEHHRPKQASQGRSQSDKLDEVLGAIRSLDRRMYMLEASITQIAAAQKDPAPPSAPLIAPKFRTSKIDYNLLGNLGQFQSPETPPKSGADYFKAFAEENSLDSQSEFLKGLNPKWALGSTVEAPKDPPKKKK